MATERVYIGVDVSKARLDVFIPEEEDKGKELHAKNTPAAVRRMILGVRARVPEAMFCCESTGGYENTLVDACREEGAPVCRMNARQVRAYAVHQGLLEKTDRIDARMIAMSAADKKPEPLAHPTDGQRALREMWTLRAALAADRDRARNRLEHLKEKESVRAVKLLLAGLDRQISRLEGLIRKAAEEEEAGRAILARATLVKGVGPLTALALAALMPELLSLNDKELAKLAGLAPICADSGTKNAPRHIQGGRGLARRALYWAALSASRHNRTLSAVYNRLVGAGKAKKVALTAVMRKLLCVIRRLVQDPGFVPAT
jgi:Transposase and inactivated derivatives